MANKGFALYKKGADLYLIHVAYEYGDSRFVGFDDKSEVYKITKMSPGQKEWIQNNDPRQSDKTKNLIFIGDYYLSRIMFQDFPKGKPYTQLPGGGGVYKVTRSHNIVNNLFKEETFLRALEKYGTFNEGFRIIKKIIREMLDVVLKQEKYQAAFTAVSIEDDTEKKKISDIFDSLKEQGKIPENFTRPQFKDGSLDYHMTIKLGELPDGFKKDLDKEVELNIESVGISKLAVALGVSGDYFSANKYQHITLAFSTTPESSKDIEDWEPLEHPFKVKGVIREFTSRKEVIKRGVFKTPVEEANQNQTGNFQAQAPPMGSGSIFPQQK